MIDELGAWNGGAGVSLETWVECMGNFRLTVGYAALLWPKFVAVGPYILRDEIGRDILETFEKRPGATPQAVEWMLNHWHLADLHLHDAGSLSADKLHFVGTLVREMWDAKLRIQFPDRPCTVEFHVPDDPDDLVDYQISFWQTRWETGK